MTYTNSIIFLLLLLVACNSRQGTTLKMNFQKGKIYTYTIKDQTETDITSGGETANSSQIERGYSIEVVSDSAGVKTLKNTVTRMSMDIHMRGEHFNVDTDQPLTDTSSRPNESQVLKGMFHALKGTSFYIKVDSFGKLVDVTGIKEMGEAMLRGMRLDENLRPIVQQSFAQYFNETTLKQSFSQFFDIYPGKPVSNGDTWEKTVSLPSVQTFTHTVYTVKDISSGKVVVTAVSDMDMSGSKGNQSASYVIDAKTGLIISGNYEQKFEQPIKLTSKGKITGEEK